MMFRNQLKDPKTRRWLPVGILCVMCSLFAMNFFHPTGKFAQGWFDASCGLALGIGIGIHLMVMIRIRLGRQLRSSKC